MSRRAEEGHEKWMHEHITYLTEHMTIGAKVYRPGRDYNIEEGTIRSIGECYFGDNGGRYTIHTDADRIRASGKTIHRCWTADFGGGLFDDMTQTYEHLFFLDYRHAHAAQAKKIKSYIDELQRQVHNCTSKFNVHMAKADGMTLGWRGF